MPLYAQIATELEKKILDGDYPTGSVIPSEKLLQEMYSVSRMTVRMAMGSLVNKGYLECLCGIGTVVTYGKIEEKLRHVTSFTEEMQAHGTTMKTRLCEINVVNTPEVIAKALDIEQESQIYRLVRVRCAQDVPLAYSVTYLNIAGLPLQPECYTDSLYAFLEKELNITVARGEDTLEAVMADATVERMLDVARHSPVFKRTRIAFDSNERKIEHSTSYYPGDKYKYSVHL